MQVMLAQTASLDKLSSGMYTGYYIQNKLNGIRALWDPEQKKLYTRNGIEIVSVPHIKQAIMESGFSTRPFDGELYIHNYSHQRLNGQVRSKKTPFPECEYHIFDLVYPLQYKDRVRQLSEIETVWKHESIKFVPAYLTTGIKNLQPLLQHALENNYEGIMLRHPSYLYENKRSKGLLKVKPTFEAEFELVALVDTDSRNSATFGAMMLVTEEGNFFKCAGLSDGDREEVYYRYTHKKPDERIWVTVIYGALSEDKIPIFPRFKTLRWDV